MNADTDPELATVFSGLAATQGTAGPIGELTAHLATGASDPLVYRTICERHGVGAEPWFRAQRLDLVLAYARACLASGMRLSDMQIATLRTLRTFLRIRDGEFAARRPAEVAAILREQLEMILSDAAIDDVEDVYQVELQGAFGLGYDEYLAMTRTVFERTWMDLQREARLATSSDLEAARRQSALEPIVRMATARARSAGALFT